MNVIFKAILFRNTIVPARLQRELHNPHINIFLIKHMNSHLKSLGRNLISVSGFAEEWFKGKDDGCERVEFCSYKQEEQTSVLIRGSGRAACEPEDNRLCLWLQEHCKLLASSSFWIEIGGKFFFFLKKVFHLEMSKTNMFVPLGNQGTSQRLV